MSQRPLLARCPEAVVVYALLAAENAAIGESETVDVATAFTRQSRVITLQLGQRFFETTIEVCEGCEVQESGLSLKQCPSEDVLRFIASTMLR